MRVERLERGERGLEGVRADDLQAPPSRPARGGPVQEQRAQVRGERIVVAVRVAEAVVAVVHEVRQGAGVHGHHRSAGGHGLERDQALQLRGSGVDEDVHRGVGAGDLRVGQRTGRHDVLGEVQLPHQRRVGRVG